MFRHVQKLSPELVWEFQTPNLVIAHCVCENCQNEFSRDTKCETCGNRCIKCNSIDRETGQYAKPPCEGKCGQREVIFKGSDTSNEFGRWLFDESHKNYVVFAHNMRSYDGYPILQYLISQGIRPKITFCGNKIMHIDVANGLNMRVLDSLNFLPMKLSQLPGAFDLKEMKKGYFPHYFNKVENQHYKGPYPYAHYYGCDAMSTEEREKFTEWYNERLERGDTFDFAKEIIPYCRSDVDILKRACLAFREILLNITGKVETTLDEVTGEFAEENVGGLDPFNAITIAGVCTNVFRTTFLTETWNVKLRKDGILTEWLTAHKKDGEFTVEVNGETLDGHQLQQQNYVIEESSFVNSPIGQINATGYVSRDQFSKVSIHWLEWIMQQNRRKGNPLYIRHALNDGEFCLPGTKFKLEGYTPPCESHPKGLAYEFLGCYFHGCPVCYPTKSLKTVRTSQSMDELLQLTLKKQRYIESLGMEYTYIWEHDFHAQVKKDKNMDDFLQTHDIQDRLNPRDAFFGGRTNATKLEYKVREGEQIHYADFTSLYPYVNKYAKYPVGHPEIVTREFEDIGKYFGIAKVKVAPSRKLYHPVLPLKINGKLTFCLCRTCAANGNQDTLCRCDEEAISLTGPWCTPEIMKALEHGYRIIKIYEVYHWPNSSQHIFEEYINMFLKIKQEASGWSDWVQNDDDKYRYIEDYHRSEGIRLDKDKIKKNKALRSLAKLLLNSFWGKFGQRANLPQTSFYHETETDEYFQCLSNPQRVVEDFHIITSDLIQLSWANKDESIAESMQSNVFIAAFTTCNARLKLYSCLEELQRKSTPDALEGEIHFDRSLYMDTDSIVHVNRPGDLPLSYGDNLGELTSELSPGDYITHFVSGGPKQYAPGTSRVQDTRI